VKLYPISLAFILLLASAPPASPLGKSPPPEAARPAQSAPDAATPQKPAAAPPAAQPVPGAIAVQDIPLEADRLLTVLRALEERVALSSAVSGIEARLPEMTQRIRDAQVETKVQLEAVSSLTMLTNLSDLWAGIQGDVRAWADALRVRAADVGAVIDQLSVLADTWTRTREEAVRSKVPLPVLKRIDDTLGAIPAARAQATARRAALLTLQVKVGELLAVVEESSVRVAKATAADMSTLLQPDSPPVWRAWQEGPALADLPARVRESAAPQLGVFARYAAGRYRASALHVVLFAGLLAFALAARRQIRVWAATGNADPMLRVFELPVATALVVSLLLTDWMSARPPMIALNVMGLILLVPVVRILTRLTAPAPTAAIWAAVVFFVLNRLRDIALLSAPVVEQYVMLVISAGSALSLAWLWRRRALVVGTYKVPEPVVWLGLGLLVASFVLGAVGCMRLGRLLSGGVLRSAYTALELYTAALVVLAMFAYLLRIWPLARLRMVDRHHLLFERRAQILVSWGVTVVWLASVLRWFSLLGPVENLTLAVLDYHVTRGFVSLSLGDALAFVATVWVAFLVSRFVRFVLAEDVYPRLPMGRGLPYAISSLLHYLILLLGFLAAIGAMGVDLNRVTLLTGAFGVGVGFGLQTIVNNFVSGIILLLERPIQVGDAIQMTDLDGEVRRIGIRSTTVHTWRGAEVIVPNATLISGNLTNWTLSDRTRRFELVVGVAYGTDPQRVIDLLRAAAASVPGVLANPAPVVLFQTFGDSALNFEVRAWTARFEEWAAIHSQVGVAVNAALKAAGIEVPFPQRDVTLRFPPREET
jgi:small-conductance mechanosensitive channel